MVSNDTSKKIYNGDGSITTFAYDFYIFQDSDLVVVLKNTSTGVETTQTLNSDYTVTGAGNENGGNVVFTTAPASGYKVIIYRELDITQTTDYVENDDFPAASHEAALDRLTMIAQQLQEQIDRSLLRSIDQTSPLTFPSLESGKFLTTDGSSLSWGTPTVVDYNGSMAYGTAANKPASPSKGDMYVETDTGKFYICYTSGTWTQIGAMTEVADDTTPTLGGELDADSNKIVNLSDPTDAQDAATKAYVDGLSSGKVKQVVYTQTGSVATGTGTIPDDDTIPQNTEGTEFMTLSITPSSDSTRKLKVDVVVNGSIDSTVLVTAALFKDSDANALACASSYNNNGWLMNLKFSYILSVATSSTITFKVRVGGSSGTFTLNGVGGSRKMGGTLISSITITEIEP